MEIAYQNKNEDLDAYSDYFINETVAGKKFSLRLFLLLQAVLIISVAIFGIVIWLISGTAKDAIFMMVMTFFLLEFIFSFISGYKPRYYFAKTSFKKQVEARSNEGKPLSFLLPRKCIINDDWVEILGPESNHRWRWKIIERAELRPDFIYIHVNQYYVFIIPKRDFSSEQEFVDFSSKISALKRNVDGENHDTLLSPKPIASSAQSKHNTQYAAGRKRNAIYTFLFALIGILLCCGFGYLYTTKGVFVNSTEIPTVLDEYMKSMVSKDIERASSFFSNPSDGTHLFLSEQINKPNYALYSNYQNIEITSWNLRYEGVNGEASVSGKILYKNEFEGAIYASLSTDNGQWKINNITVYASPSQIESYLSENGLK